MTDSPLIGPGVGSAAEAVTLRILGAELPQELLAVTDTVPPFTPIVLMMVLLVDVPVQPFGSDQVYEVALLTGATEKVSGLPVLHEDVLLVILPSVTGAEPIVTASVCSDELPQLLLALTVTMPPLEPAVATM